MDIVPGGAEIAITDLLDECLRIILLFVPLGNRIKLREGTNHYIHFSVSHQWCEVIDDCWRAVRKVNMSATFDMGFRPTIGGIGDTVETVHLAPNIFEAMPEDFANDQFTILPERMHEFAVPVARIQKEMLLRCSSPKILETCFIDGELMDLIGRNTQLEKLYLFFHAVLLDTNILVPILNLKNLSQLHLSQRCGRHKGRRVRVSVPLTDEFLIAIAINLCQLERITLGASEKITDNGLMWLSTLNKLRTLSISSCINIKGEILHLFSHLQELSIWSSDIGDESVIKLIEKTRILKVLCLEGIWITRRTIITAIEATKQRTNGPRLRLYGHYESATKDTFKEASPFLSLIDFNVEDHITSRIPFT